MVFPAMRLAVPAILAMAAMASAQGAGRDRVFNITDFGAVGDGKAMNTQAIARAMEACASAGGGRVDIPAGTFLTGPIELRGNVELHVADGATVLFSRNALDYPAAKFKPEQTDAVQRTSPLWADGQHDVAITGGGTFDGQGDAWRPVKKSKVPPQMWEQLVKSGGHVVKDTWYPPRADATSEGARDLYRPCLVLLSNCRRVRLDGPTFRNSPGWNIHLLLSEDITVHSVTCFNEAWAQNGDSLDIDSCRNVTVTNCTLSGGDDVVCLKSGKDEAGRRRARPTENVVVSNCTIGSGHGGITIGSEMSGGVRNVSVTNCILNGTDGGLRFKTTRGRGGVVENIRISNIEMSDIHEGAITFNMYYGVKQPGATSQPVSEGTPQFRDFQISNIHCTGAKAAIQLRGLPEMLLDGITIENARLKADEGGYIIDARNITLRNVQVDAGRPVQIENAPELTLERVRGLARP